MGDSIFIDNAGNTTIYTACGKTFIFKNYREQKGSWIIYTDENGNYLKGYYSQFSYTSFAPYLPDIIDSAATLRIRAYDTSNHVIESHLSTDILVSKNYGVNKIFEFNEIDDIDKYYFILYNVGIEKADFNSGFSQKDEYESVLLSLEIGSETHIKYEDFNSDEYHYQIRKVIAKDIGDSLVNYTFQYCDSIPNEDTIIQSVVTKSYNYRLRDRELHRVEIFGGKETFIDITKFFITDWHGKKHFKFYNRFTDHMWDYNSRDYWIFTDPDVMGNYGTKYYEFIEGVGEILVDANYLLDEVHYFKTSTNEWGTPFTHSCSNSSGLSETQIAQIAIYPNPT